MYPAEDRPPSFSPCTKCQVENQCGRGPDEVRHDEPGTCRGEVPEVSDEVIGHLSVIEYPPCEPPGGEQCHSSDQSGQPCPRQNRAGPSAAEAKQENQRPYGEDGQVTYTCALFSHDSSPSGIGGFTESKCHDPIVRGPRLRYMSEKPVSLPTVHGDTGLVVGDSRNLLMSVWPHGVPIPTPWPVIGRTNE